MENLIKQALEENKVVRYKDIFEKVCLSYKKLLEQGERFKKPTDKQLVDISLIFNEGKIEQEKLADMFAMCEFVIDRLYENGDVMIPTKKEEEIENDKN